MINFVQFQKHLKVHYPDKPMRLAYVRDQYDRLRAGERGGNLSDAALLAWESAGREVE